MIKICKKCGNRMMIVKEGIPQYAHGSYIIYGCPSCGKLEYEYDSSNCDENRVKSIFDPQDLGQFYVSN